MTVRNIISYYDDNEKSIRTYGAKVTAGSDVRFTGDALLHL